jgi:hypothetical protein
MGDSTDSHPERGDLRALVEELLNRIETHQHPVDGLTPGEHSSGGAVGPTMVNWRSLTAADELAELGYLAEWVEWLQERYATEGDWLLPCWWQHGFVVEELAALRTAWRGVYDSDKAIDPSGGVKWHEEAEKCRQRIRRAISAGPGCSVVSHKPDELVTDDPRWAEELTALRIQLSERGARPRAT